MEITCDKVAKTISKDYEYCIIKIDNEGNAKVSIKGKFNEMAICNESKETSEIRDTYPTDDSYFICGETEINAIVNDENKCINYFARSFYDGVYEICDFNQ